MHHIPTNGSSRYTPCMPTLPSLTEVSLDKKKVIVRAGFDVPIEDGVVTDASRIEAIVPTMRHVLDQGGALILLAHQGRPKGAIVPTLSQQPLLPILERLLKTSVHFAPSCTGAETRGLAKKLKKGEVLLLENVRFDPREEKNDLSFAEELAALGDIYVNDAFSNSHRSHASMVALASLLPAYAGLQLAEEVRHLSSVIEDPRRPVTLILSGAKIETKLPVIEFFLQRGDDILTGGAIANTLLAARGFNVGQSKKDDAFLDTARALMLRSEQVDLANIHVPRDAIVASIPSEDAEVVDMPLENIMGDMAIFDIGRVTTQRYVEIIRASGSIIWNGPLGMYEVPQFSHASIAIADAVRRATQDGAISVIGGGDTLDFHARAGLPLDGYTFASTGGGAMLDFVSGKELPALRALTQRS
jgi:phosphoglycerate kinase